MDAGRLEGKVVVVSGVGPGLGRRVAEAAGAEGAAVVLGARSVDYLEELAGALKERAVPVVYRRSDVTVADDCRELVAAGESSFGGVDALVCNASASGPFNVTLEDCNLDEWQQAFDVNLFGSLRLVQAAIPAMKQRGGGSVVFIGSQIVRRVFAGRGAYASSKAALLTASHVLARELGPYDIRVNTVVPGRMWGPSLQAGIGRLAASRGMTVEEQRQKMLDDVSLPRLATDEECARAVLFLLSDLSAGMTGQSIDVNAGETFH
ncbi:MAG TPA: SDR family oxidoreductase [Acidimicrobiales bacterium]|nr:SDR family oxidoreductase [Acidimicrobiales bacterium]